MKPEEEKFMENLQSKNEQMQTNLDFAQMNQVQREMAQQQQQLSIAVEQLNMSEEIERMDHLLRGEYQQADKEGNIIWIKPTSKSSIILSEEGVQYILNSISFYLNKNTLLSNYTEEVIDKKMEDYAISLSDVLFMRSELYFDAPTYHDAVEEYEKGLNKKIEKEVAMAKLQQQPCDEGEIRKKLLKDVDMNKAIDGLQKQMKNDKLRGFEHLLRCVQDVVHSAYLRAWNGQERRSLRSSFVTSEHVGGQQGVVQSQSSKLNPFGWFGRGR